MTGTAISGEDLARRTGAGLLIRGRYTRQGEQLEFSADLVDVAAGKVLTSAGPAQGATINILHRAGSARTQGSAGTGNYLFFKAHEDSIFRNISVPIPFPLKSDLSIGDIAVSTMYANFFINRGKGCAADFIRLMHEVAGRVSSTFGITLEPEIKIVGRDNGNR